MQTAGVAGWKPMPKWLYWVAAPLAPAFIAIGAVLCIGLSLVLGQEPIDPSDSHRWRSSRRR
jgi:hypothetical protein